MNLFRIKFFYVVAIILLCFPLLTRAYNYNYFYDKLLKDYDNIIPEETIINNCISIIEPKIRDSCIHAGALHNQRIVYDLAILENINVDDYSYSKFNGNYKLCAMISDSSARRSCILVAGGQRGKVYGSIHLLIYFFVVWYIIYISSLYYFIRFSSFPKLIFIAIICILFGIVDILSCYLLYLFFAHISILGLHFYIIDTFLCPPGICGGGFIFPDIREFAVYVFIPLVWVAIGVLTVLTIKKNRNRNLLKH